MDRTQRTALSETFRELANIVAGALALSQLVGEQPPSIWLILTGIFGWLSLIIWGLLLVGDSTDG